MTLTLRSDSQGTAEYFRFTFEPLGWAIFTINEKTGEFTITSDWGHYAHRWNPDHTGSPSMKHFIVTAGSHYIVNKLCYNVHRQDKEQFQHDRSKDALRSQLIEWRRDGQLSKAKARHLWAELDDVFYQADCWDEEESYIVQNWPRALYEHIECPWDYFVFDLSPRLKFVQNELIPFFQNWLRPRIM